MKEVIWMEVTRDRLELPLAVAGSAGELARMCGVSESAVWTANTHRKTRGTKTRFIRVEITETEEQTNEE